MWLDNKQHPGLPRQLGSGRAVGCMCPGQARGKMINVPVDGKRASVKRAVADIIQACPR